MAVPRTLRQIPVTRRLEQLASDPIFTTLPPGATVVSLTKTPAKYRHEPFQTPGWDGASVILRFASAQPVLAVYAYYRDYASKHGWKVDAVSTGVIVQWRKQYPKAEASILLLQDGGSANEVSRTWALRGSTGPTRS